MASDIKQLETKLWAAADELRANSNLTLAQYSEPVLGLIFLKFVDGKFKQAKADVEKKATTTSGRTRSITKEHYQAQGLLYIPEEGNVGQKINNAMKLIETENESSAGGVAVKDVNGWEVNSSKEYSYTHAMKGWELFDLK